MPFTRREFVQAAGATAAFGLSGTADAQMGCSPPATVPATSIRLFGDGLGLTPQAFAELLNVLCRDSDIVKDNYLLGGEVQAFERHCAATLGKEMAVFMPSGTLANQLALRALAGTRRRVIVPGLSHVYNDTGDACQTLAGLNLIPLALNRATFTLDEVDAVLARTAGGRVTTEVGAILIESPMRRLQGEMFDWAEMNRIAAYARERDIGIHLDGARIFIASAYTGVSPADYAAPFDTVFISLWKYFNSGIGAILAGPKSLLEDMFHVRRMFGGNLYEGWSSALVARHYMNGFIDRMQRAVRVSEAFYSAVESVPGMQVTRIPNGTNVARMTLAGADMTDVRRRLKQRDIFIGRPSAEGVVTMVVNETWNRTTGEILARAFEEAIV